MLKMKSHPAIPINTKNFIIEPRTPMIEENINIYKCTYTHISSLGDIFLFSAQNRDGRVLVTVRTVPSGYP